MYADVTALVNAALANIGEQPISNFATDPGKQGIAARAMYDSLRDALFSLQPWRFASHTVLLVESANDPNPAWGYRFEYPSAALYVHAVLMEGQRDPRDPKIPFEISYDAIAGARSIQCDISIAYALITRSVTDTTKWSQRFTDAMEWQLSAKLALRLARDKQMRKETLQIAQDKLAVAQVADANESYLAPLEPGAVRARR